MPASSRGLPVPGLPTGRPLLGVTALWGAVAGLMFLVLLPAVAAGCGAPALDARPSWSGADAAALLAACSPEGLAAYGRQQAVDVAYPILMALTVGGWIAVGARRLGLARTPTRALLVPSALALVADLVENAAVVTLLTRGTIPVWLSDLGGAASLTKNVAGALSFAVVACLGVAVLATSLRVAGASSSLRPDAEGPPRT